jgi:hypothetical protein
MTKQFNLQFFSEGEEAFGEDAVTEEVAEEVVDTPVDESEATDTEEEQEPDFSEANKEFLDRFKVQFDGKDKSYESMDQLIADAQQGGALPRYKEKVSKYESNPLYKYIDNYMKDSGYEDPQTFVNDMNINTKKQDYIAKGMSDEDAQAAAEEYVGKGQPSVDIKSKEIDSFLSWHQEKVESGKFEGELDVNNIPDAVKKSYEGGMSLKEAYLDYVLDDIKVKTEQKTIKNIVKNKETSSGELNTSPTNTTKNMTPAQIDKVLGGMSQKEQGKWVDKNYDLIEKSGYFKQ